MPALPYIQDLQIVATDAVCIFPESVAGALRSLTSLSLSGNSFERIPASLATIATLQKLDLSKNYLLGLHVQDLDTLSRLTCLQVLDIRYMGSNNLWENAEILTLIGERFPALHILSEY